MTGPLLGQGFGDDDGTTPTTKEHIEGCMSALRSLVKEHNNRGNVSPIRLNFDVDRDDTGTRTIVTGKDVGRTDLKSRFKETILDKRACFKDSTEITKIVRKANETLMTFKEGWTVETGFILDVPKIMKISLFMDAHKCSELAKHYSNKVPKTVDDMMVRLDDFMRSEEALANFELPKGRFSESSRKLSGTYNRREDRQLESALELRKLNHLMKDIRQKTRGGPKGKDEAKDKNGNGPVSVTTDTNGMIKVLPSKTAEEVVTKERKRKARTTLLMALPKDHLAKSHKMADAKEMSLPSFWSQVALIMRTKPGLDTFSFDDPYNNLRVFEHDVKGTTASSLSNTHNVAFVSADNTSNTNDINDDDIEEMDLKWQVAMISMRIKKFHKRTGRKLQFDIKDPVGFDKTKVECFNCYKIRHFARDCRAKRNQDSRRGDGGYNGNKARDNGRRLAYQDDSKALVTIDGEDIDWSGHVEEDTQKYAMMAYSSSNSGSDNESMFMNKECDLEDTPVNHRYTKGMHVVPPPMTGNYMPSGPNVEIDYSKFTYGTKQILADESDSKPVEYASSESDSSVETTTSMPALVDNAPKIVCEPKVWTDAPIIEEYESDSDDDLVSNVQENMEKPSFAFINSVKHVKSPKENIKETNTPNHIPKTEKQDRYGHTRHGLGYTRKACFICGSFSHLIRDCDFHEKRMAKQAALTKGKNKEDPHKALKDKGIVDSGCSRHMIGNKAHLADY
uniref:Ribonuclease H-like domain-containing protein n=1 Tax=Tanacetum cinerariifolium TaxID=118510 RepID=A0A699GQT4_TANCI|nr:ribonuclease H-like domain-containing protein [Tanacetum cinerariifolium]